MRRIVRVRRCHDPVTIPGRRYLGAPTRLLVLGAGRPIREESTMRAGRVVAGLAVVAAASAPMLLVPSATAQAHRSPTCCAMTADGSPTGAPHWRLVVSVR